MTTERVFQSQLIRRLKAMFPGCYVLKNDSGYMQGVPDLLILYKQRWGFLEVKSSREAKHRPNQDYHINALNAMSFASFISPETELEVLHELQQALSPRRAARLS